MPISWKELAEGFASMAVQKASVKPDANGHVWVGKTQHYVSSNFENNTHTPMMRDHATGMGQATGPTYSGHADSSMHAQNHMRAAAAHHANWKAGQPGLATFREKRVGVTGDAFKPWKGE